MTDTCNSNEPQKNSMLSQKKSNTKDYLLYYCIYMKFQKRQTTVRRSWADIGDERFLNFPYLNGGGGYKLYIIAKIHQPDPCV